MIQNKTQGTVLCESHEVADSGWSKTLGLMFRKELSGNHGLLMTFDGESRPGIWMLGMRFPIDIIFMDSEKGVVGVVENARPLGFSWRTWRIFKPETPASYVLELPAGRAKETKTRIGDILRF